MAGQRRHGRRGGHGREKATAAERERFSFHRVEVAASVNSRYATAISGNFSDALNK
jgi:hypothetical protein